MTLKFCPKCKNILIPRTRDNETLMLCDSCGWFEIVKGKVNLNEKEKFGGLKEGEGVFDVNKERKEMASFDNICEKCGYGKAEVWDAGVQYSDEDELIFVKCGKCGHVERIGRKVA